MVGEMHVIFHPPLFYLLLTPVVSAAQIHLEPLVTRARSLQSGSGLAVSLSL